MVSFPFLPLDTPLPPLFWSVEFLCQGLLETIGEDANRKTSEKALRLCHSPSLHLCSKHPSSVDLPRISGTSAVHRHYAGPQHRDEFHPESIIGCNLFTKVKQQALVPFKSARGRTALRLEHLFGKPDTIPCSATDSLCDVGQVMQLLTFCETGMVGQRYLTGCWVDKYIKVSEELRY